MNATILLSLALAAPPADLAMVPQDAIAIVHIRGKDLWKSELMTGLRTTLEKAGPKAFAAFDGGFYPTPSTISGFTGFILAPEEGEPVGPKFVGIIAFETAFDAAKVRAIYCEGESKAVPGKSIYRLKDEQMCLYFPDDKHIVFSLEERIVTLLTRKPGKANKAIASAIERAATGSTVVAAVDLAILPPQFRHIPNAPEGIEPLLAASAVTLTLDTAGGATKFAMAAQYMNETAAVDAEKAAKMALGMAMTELMKMKPEMEAVLFGTAEKKFTTPRPLNDLPAAAGALMGLGSINQFEELIKNPPFARNGDKLALEFTVPKEMVAISGYYAMGLGLMLPAVQKVREAAGRMNGQNNLKQIGLALHSYNDTTGTFPSQAPNLNGKGPKDSKKRLSWRVHILPYFEQDVLYRKFKFDEPWDSENNKKLIPLMPKVYADPRQEAGEGKTFYKGIAGPEAIFAKERGSRFQDITDGTSNTIMVVAGGDAVIWTAPDDIEFDSKKPLPDLAKPFGPTTIALFADGSVRTIDFAKLKPETIKALFTIAGGEVIPGDDLDPTKQFGLRIAPAPVPVPQRKKLAAPPPPIIK